MTATLEGGEWSAARSGRTLPPGKTRYPFYRRLGGSQGRSAWAENLVPSGIRSRTVQLLLSRYTDWATGPTKISAYEWWNWWMDWRKGVSRWMDAYRWIGEWMNIWRRVDGWMDWSHRNWVVGSNGPAVGRYGLSTFSWVFCQGASTPPTPLCRLEVWYRVPSSPPLRQSYITSQLLPSSNLVQGATIATPTLVVHNVTVSAAVKFGTGCHHRHPYASRTSRHSFCRRQIWYRVPPWPPLRQWLLN